MFEIKLLLIINYSNKIKGSRFIYLFETHKECVENMLVGAKLTSMVNMMSRDDDVAICFSFEIIGPVGVVTRLL
jgi:hypothetical protein